MTRISKFEKRQQMRVAKLKIHKRRSAHLMRKLGGYRSPTWADHIYSIKRKIENLGRGII